MEQTPATALTVLLLSLFVAAPKGRAQEPEEKTAAAFARGWQAFQEKDYRRAAERFEKVVNEMPAYQHSQHGAAAYWLGRAYGAAEQPEKQVRAYRKGLAALRQEGRFSFRLADVYLRVLPTSPLAENPQAAQRTYRRLLHYLGSGLSSEEKRYAAAYVEQLAPLLPKGVRERVLAGTWEGRPDDPAQWRFREGAGRVLRAWWRRQDPFPLEPRNERLAEHLRRVAYAREQYAYGERLSGYDDRGRLFVKYGPPARRTKVEIDDPGRTVGAGANLPSLERLRSNTPAVSNANFPPPNELWFYRHINEAGYYLFVEKADHFRLGSVTDLVPRRLQTIFPDDRTRAAAGFQALLSIYEKLSLEHSDFASRYSDLTTYLNKDVLFKQSLQAFVTAEYLDSRTEDQQARRRREKAMPRQYSALGSYMEELPVAVRTARFLDEDGRTRTEVYWRPRPGALGIGEERRARLSAAGAPVGEAALLRLVLARQDGNYITRDRQAKTYLVDGALRRNRAQSSAFPLQTTTVREDDRRFHLVMRWSEYGVRPSKKGRVRPGPRVRRTVRRVDSLEALATDRLEMSDLRPVAVPEKELIGMEHPGEQTRFHVYLPDTLAADTPLALYFEVYHLAYGADDQAHYTVEYEVQRRTERGGLAGLFGGDREERTSTKATYTSRTRRSEEFITLNLKEGAKEGTVRVAVRLTDETTGRAVERSVRFIVKN